MESCICNPLEKAIGLHDGIIPCTEVTRIKDIPTTCELERSCNNNSTVLFSCQDVTESLTYREGSTQKAFSMSSGELSDTTTHLQAKPAYHSFSQKAALGEEETGSKSSSSVIDSDNKDSSIIDLKLGRISDCGYSKKSNPLRDAETFKSHASSITAKRIRSTCLSGQTSFCQVLNCNIDLSDSKDYYKRHRVCELHSKTAVVIVNGIQQRFCQKCSRFHLLDAFDEGKRSCRKRLAGHNERRRKPQIDINSARTGRMTQLYCGMAILGTSSSGSTSFVSPYMFLDGILQGANHENATWPKQTQSWECTFSSDGPSPVTVDGQPSPRSLDAAYGTQMHLSCNVANATTPESIHFNRGNQYEVGYGASPLVFDNELHNKNLHVLPVSTCAHSLLSYPQPEGCYSYQRAAEVQASSGVNSGSCYLSRMNNLVDQQTDILASYSESFDDQSSVSFQGSRLMSNKDHFAHENGQAIDLLQLSSLLQNAENRRRSVPDPLKSFTSF